MWPHFRSPAAAAVVFFPQSTFSAEERHKLEKLELQAVTTPQNANSHGAREKKSQRQGTRLTQTRLQKKHKNTETHRKFHPHRQGHAHTHEHTRHTHSPHEHTRTHKRTNKRANTRMCAHAHAHINTHASALRHARTIRTYTTTLVNSAHVYTQIHTHTHAYTRKHIQMHIQWNTSKYICRQAYAIKPNIYSATKRTRCTPGTRTSSYSPETHSHNKPTSQD